MLLIVDAGIYAVGAALATLLVWKFLPETPACRSRRSSKSSSGS